MGFMNSPLSLFSELMFCDILQVLNNISLNVNSVGFYQIMKIAITPTVVFLEFAMFKKVHDVS